jgi:hypothetical protein
VCLWRIRSARNVTRTCVARVHRVAGGKSISFSLDSRYVAFSGVFSLVVELTVDKIAIDTAFFRTTRMRFSSCAMTHASVVRNKIVFHLAAVEDRGDQLAAHELEETVRDIRYCQRGQRLAASMKRSITMLDVSNVDAITALFTVKCEPGPRTMTPLGRDLIVIDRQNHAMSTDCLSAWTLKEDGTMETLQWWEGRGHDLLGVSPNGLWLVMNAGRTEDRGNAPFATVVRLRHELVLKDSILWRRMMEIQQEIGSESASCNS